MDPCLVFQFFVYISNYNCNYKLKANRCPPVLGTNPTETLCEGRKDREAEEREWPEHKVILANCVKL